MTKIEHLETTIVKLKNIAINLTVDKNILTAKVTELEAQLAAARREVRGYEIGTQTMRKLAILGDKSDDENGGDPRQTGQYRVRAWDHAQ